MIKLTKDSVGKVYVDGDGFKLEYIGYTKNMLMHIAVYLDNPTQVVFTFNGGSKYHRGLKNTHHLAQNTK